MLFIKIKIRFAMRHFAGDHVVVYPFVPIGQICHPLTHRTGRKVEVIPDAVSEILTFNHMTIGIVTNPFTSVRTQINILIVRHGSV